MISQEKLAELQKVIQASERNAIFWWLMHVPYASINDLARLSGYNYQQIRSEFTRMRRERLAFAVKVGWHRRIQERLGLAREGVHQASELFLDGAIPWPVTEEGHQHMLDRLPILEIINELAPALRVQWLAQLNQQGSDETLESSLAIAFGGLRLSQLHWVWQGRPVAVGRYNQGAQIPFVYVDRQANGGFVTEQDRLRFAGMSTPDDDPAGRTLRPPHWVIICDGPIAEELARQRLYPDEPRILVRSTKANWATACPPSLSQVTGSPLMSPRGPTTLGHPERTMDWVKDDDSMLIYRDRLAGRLFSLAEDSLAARPTDAARIWKVSGTAVKGSAQRLVDAGLCFHGEGGLQLAHSGALLIARRSGLHHQTILGRYGLLGDRRRITRNEQLHRRSLSRLRVRLAGQGQFLELGDRLHFNPGEAPPHFPDAWIHIETPDGDGKLHAVELEGPRPHWDRAELRLKPYLGAQEIGTPQPLLMVFLSRESEESCMRLMPRVSALTTTIDEALRGPDRGERSVWRYSARVVDIHHLLTVEPEAPIPQMGLVDRLRQWWGGNER